MKIRSGAVARFDDLRPGARRAFTLIGLRAVMVADHPGDVPELLAAVEHRVAAGSWAAGVVSYDAAPGFEPAMSVPGPTAGPVAWFGLFAGPEPAGPLSAHGGTYRLGGWRAGDGPGRYRNAVAAIRDRIGAGDTYQVNFTTRLAAGFSGDPGGLYRDLAGTQSGAGYCAHLEFDGLPAVVSASPELFFARRDGRIAVRPMKGTAPRGRWIEEDEEAGAALAVAEKDRAENLMIVDLLRNDLGRIARFGSVRVDDLFAVERIGTAWQMTSSISAVPRAGAGLADVFAALFPCGSVTGAPKLAAMRIITELEGAPRGIYCGAVGVVSPAASGEPDAVFSVAIRTVEIDAARTGAVYGTGGAVTWDSSPDGEHREALVKASVLARRSSGLAVFTTLRWEPGEGWWWREEQLDRLEASCRYFSIPFDRGGARRALDELVPADGPLRVRLEVDGAGGLIVTAAPAPPSGEPVTVAVDIPSVDPADPLLYHKTTRRDRYDEARRRHPGVEDVILVNRAGEVTESTVANVAARIGGRWVTPPLRAGCLPGVLRRVLLERGELTEEPLTVADLEAAGAVELVSALRGRRPVRLRGIEEGGQHGDVPGAATAAIAFLEEEGAAFAVHAYGPIEVEAGYGEAVAALLGIPAERMFKTLVAAVDGDPGLAVIPVAARLSMRKLARVRGGKRADMTDPADAARLTGYVVGGISPFGCRRPLPVVVEEIAVVYDTIFVSGGRRGVQLEVAPADLIALTGAATADLVE